MLARSAKPKLTLNLSSIATAAAAATTTTATATTNTPSTRPILSLKSPLLTPLRSPASPAPNSPTTYNTRMNQRGVSTMQHPTYSYSYGNHSTSRSILKKGQSPSSATRRHLQFSEQPQVLCFSPVEDEDAYYGDYKKMSRDERRWMVRS